MIYADNEKIMVSGDGLDVAAQLGAVIRDIAASMKRQGDPEEDVRQSFHRLVDIALEAPSSGTTIDLSFKKED